MKVYYVPAIILSIYSFGWLNGQNDGKYVCGRTNVFRHNWMHEGKMGGHMGGWTDRYMNGSVNGMDKY